MKLLRIGEPGKERPALLDAAGQLRDLSKFIVDIRGETLLPGSLAMLADLNASTLPAVTGAPRIVPSLCPGVQFLPLFPYSSILIYVQKEVGADMASSPDSHPSRKLGRPPRGWARKNLHIDQRKLDSARKALGVKTETETVDAALDAIVLRKELSGGIRRLRTAGGLKDIYRD